MHPAFSVLVFTVTSGAGYGLIALLVLFHSIGLDILANKKLLLTAGIIAISLITAGLLSSTLHLAKPKNAWRSFSRFKTSWLSREAVFAVVFYPFVLLYLIGISLQGSQVNILFMLFGATTLLLAIATLFCTSMIYASLKTIRQWNTSLTPINYLLLGLMSGSLLLLSIQVLMTGKISSTLYQVAISFVITAAAVKLIYLFWIGKPGGSTIRTATGFTQASVRLLDQGHTANGFLNNEFGYHMTANKLLLLRFLMVFLSFVIPILCLLSRNIPLIVFATVSTLLGLFIERWLFFAEARHVVRLYHGDQTT